MEKLLSAKALERYGANADDAGGDNAEAEDGEAEVNELSASGRVEPDADCAPPAPPALSMKPLSQLQQDIVDDPARAKLIRAVAGSGKTEVLVHIALKAAREGTNVLFVTKVRSVTFEIMKRLKAHLKIAEFAESGNHYYTRLGSGAVIEPPQAPGSSQAATPAAASELGPSTPPPAKRSKRTEAKQAAEPSQPTKGKGKAQGKAAKAEPAPQPGSAQHAAHWGEQVASTGAVLVASALPAKGKEYPGLGYKRLRDNPRKTPPPFELSPAYISASSSCLIYTTALAARQ
ncbi:hypothetical protein QJQ45_009184 [Haematococcus lacustris]|nr:hypothetical protein QJQ45_009184 [Haematococcus lacustris]